MRCHDVSGFIRIQPMDNIPRKLETLIEGTEVRVSKYPGSQDGPPQIFLAFFMGPRIVRISNSALPRRSPSFRGTLRAKELARCVNPLK